MPIQELAPFVGVEAKQFKWQRGFRGSGGFHDAVGSFVPDRPVAGPSAQDVAIGHAPDEVPFQTTSTVRHRVGFQESGPGDVPVVRADRYLGFEQPPRAWCRNGHGARFEPCAVPEADPTPQR